MARQKKIMEPQQAVVISFMNHKGGVGKTTSTVNIAAGLVNLHKRVLLIDLDPQANLSFCVEGEGRGRSGAGTPDEGTPTIYNTLLSGAELNIRRVRKFLDYVPANLELANAEITLNAKLMRELLLREALKPHLEQYDFILIDTPPSIGILTYNAMAACDYVLIPTAAELLPYNGLETLLKLIATIRGRLNPQLKVAGIFVTNYEGRKLNKAVTEYLKGVCGGLLMDTFIRRNIAVAEAPLHQTDIFKFARYSHGAEDYKKLTNEVLERINDMNI